MSESMYCINLCYKIHNSLNYTILFFTNRTYNNKLIDNGYHSQIQTNFFTGTLSESSAYVSNLRTQAGSSLGSQVPSVWHVRSLRPTSSKPSAQWYTTRQPNV